MILQQPDFVHESLSKCLYEPQSLLDYFSVLMRGKRIKESVMKFNDGTLLTLSHTACSAENWLAFSNPHHIFFFLLLCD